MQKKKQANFCRKAIGFADKYRAYWNSTVITICMVLLVTGCGGGSSSSSTRATPSPTPEGRLFVSELTFASSKLQGCVESLATREDWHYADEITRISCAFHGADTNLKGMEVFADMPQSNLVELWLNGAVDNLDPIAGLTTLRELGLSNHRLLDLSPLSTLTQLEYLRLVTADGCTPEMGCDLRDITALAELDNLKQLILNDRNSDLLSQISFLINLEYLRLERMELSTLSWADSLVKLEVLDLNEVSSAKHYDIDALVFLENLRELYLPYGNPKNDSLQPIASLKKLQTLIMCNLTLNDLSPLAELVEMEWLWIIRCGNPKPQGSIVDVSALSEMENLRRLSIHHQLIEDMSPLENLRKLQVLSLKDNRINYNTEVLAGFSELQYLSLSNNNISYLPPLDTLMLLSELVLDNNQVQNLQSLIGLDGLELLSISHNGLSDISPLANVSNVETLELGHNNISDISPLREMPGLQALRIESNPVTCEEISELRDAKQVSIWAGNSCVR